MGVLFDMQAFFRFLKEASDEEIARRHEALCTAIELFQDPAVSQDARFLLKELESELLARQLRSFRR